jgi:hypothetical protein
MIPKALQEVALCMIAYGQGWLFASVRQTYPNVYQFSSYSDSITLISTQFPMRDNPMLKHRDRGGSCTFETRGQLIKVGTMPLVMDLWKSIEAGEQDSFSEINVYEKSYSISNVCIGSGHTIDMQKRTSIDAVMQLCGH